MVERRTGALPDFVISYGLTELGSGLEPIVAQLAGWAEQLPSRLPG